MGYSPVTRPSGGAKMSHYRSNLRDIEFNLFEVFGAQDRLGRGPFAEVDAQTARDALGEIERFVTEVLATSYESGDRNPPTFDPVTHSVTMPAEFRETFQALLDSEWWKLDVPVELGGSGVAPSLRWAVGELLLGANPGAFLYLSGPGWAAVLNALGTPDQKKMAQRMIDRRWGATMVLTEPDAGSDVGAGRTKAIAQPDGTWHIEGVKRFITSGEHDLTENIVHLVLARPEGHGPGTKGLSLFIVPKFLFDVETGELGARNGAYATNVEKKMGIKVSTTCEMTFGANEPAVGYLLGEVHDGIAQMFHVIEYARMMVGTKAIATLSSGYLHALEYAKTRVQGADMTQMTDKTAPRVAIINHPDVRRMLMLQKSYTEGLRALIHYTALWQDRAALAQGGEGDLVLAERMNDLLLPLVKGVGSERAYEMLTLSLQTFGGSGFLQDYPIEQYIRDAKIDTLYEGTTAIQGMDFFFRKMIRDQFVAITQLGSEIQDFVKGGSADDSFARERETLGRALDDVQGMIGALGGFALKSQTVPSEIYKVGQNTNRLLLATGDLVIGWLLLRQAEIASAALAGTPTESDREFYTGKIAAARFFVANQLPKLATERAILESTDNNLMQVPQSAF
jgi:alkylation response protein AidB-like acyl-CoA dehydrogenase